MASITNFDLGKYPVVLSDALLGKATNELYSGVRYNQKVGNVTDSSSNSFQIRPSEKEDVNYDISYSDNMDEFAYEGGRTADESQFVLIFDAENEQFVLHRIDSTFDMKLVGAPWLQNATETRLQNGHHETKSTAKVARDMEGRPASKPEASRRKAEKPRIPREQTPDEDSDDGLTVEYPDDHHIQHHQYTAEPSYHRHVSEEVSEEEEDVAPDDYESLEPTLEESKSFSPVAEMSEEDMEMALEAELEQELLKESAADESDESEEE